MSVKPNINEVIKSHISIQDNNTEATKDVQDKEQIRLNSQSNKDQEKSQQKNKNQQRDIEQKPNIQSYSFIQDESKDVFDEEIDEDKIILDVIHAGQLADLRNINLKRRQLNYLKQYDQTYSIDKKVSPLILAVYGGNIEIVKELYKSNINVNYTSSPKKMSPLMVACSRGQFEIVEYLISKGADVSQQNIDGQTPLYYCFSRLKENNNYFENKNLCMKMACFLLENGAYINQIVLSEKQHTLLMYFCDIKGSLDLREKDINLTMIKFLLMNGAEVFMRNTDGQDCIDLIESHPYRDEVVLIIEQLESTSVSNLRSTQENTMEKSRHLTHSLSPSKGNQNKQKKASLQILNSISPQYIVNNTQDQQLQQLLQRKSQSYINQIQQQQIKLIQQKQQEQTAKYLQKHNQNIEIQIEEKKKTPCCKFSFF